MAKSSCTAIISALLALVATLTTIVEAQNSYPIVLVHGFSGWGPNEMCGYKYWGGFMGDIQKQLEDQGYTVYTAAVGPFSSNWDRACELYAQIKGGQVDYGHVHSTKHGHARYGRNYTGFYPEWGNTVNGKVNKIHLIGHSMGGQTIRMLAHMLEKGTAGAPEVETDPTSPLFAGGKSWVHSITTISTPNQGTTLADQFSSSTARLTWLVDWIHNRLPKSFSTNPAIRKVLALLNGGYSVSESLARLLLNPVMEFTICPNMSNNSVYDAKLEQWGIRPMTSTEKVTEYIAHVFSKDIFKPGFKDISLWSLSTDGAKEESTWVTTLPDVYYYSYSTMATHTPLNMLSLPMLTAMQPPLYPLAVIVGINQSTDWMPNDGVVNTISMEKDLVGSAIAFSGKSVKGKWNKMAQFNRVDHLAIVGTTLHPEVILLYEAMAQLLTSLPVDDDSSSNFEQGENSQCQSAASANITKAIRRLQEAAERIQTMVDLKKLCDKHSHGLYYAKRFCSTMFSSLPTRRLRG